MLEKTETRFEKNFHKEVPRDYEAFLYRIDVLENGKSEFRHYGGWHAGHVEDVDMHKYLHSSKNKELHDALETASKIVYNFLDFGSKVEMATQEAKMLSEVKASSNPLYYNKNNGGGKYCQNIKDEHDAANIIFDNIQNNSYAKTFYPKSLLQKIVNSDNKIQVRIEEFDPIHVRVLRDKMEGKTASDFDPIHVLLSENSDDLPILIGGNHSSRAAASSRTMNGLYAIEIPYNDWSKLEYSDIKYLGMLLNPEEEKPRKANSRDDLARWVVETIEEKNLYKNVNTLPIEKPEPWFNHPTIVDALKKMKLGANQRGDVTKKAKEIWKIRELMKSGTNFIDFSDIGLSENPRLKLWLKKHRNHLMESKNLDMIVKISSAQHIWSQIEKATIKFDANTDKISDHPKRVHVLIFFTSPDYEQTLAWKKSYEMWNYTYKNFYSHNMEITHEFLPSNSDKINLPKLPEDYVDEDWNC